MVLQGLSTEDANRQFWLIDKEGLLTSDMDIRAGLKEFARQDYDGEGKDLGNVVKKVHHTCMIGTSTHPGAFSETVVSVNIPSQQADVARSMK
jgi:malate dehydrogenase (oxaloacetate-decarboxylating)